MVSWIAAIVIGFIGYYVAELIDTCFGLFTERSLKQRMSDFVSARTGVATRKYK